MRVLLISCLLLSSLPALAQGDPPDTTETSDSAKTTDEKRNAEAREHYDAGKTHYTVGEFDLALESFAAAYKLRPAPLLLFNMGQSARQLGRHERAVFFLEGFLREADPDDANRALVEELLDEERAEVAAVELEIAPSSDPVVPDTPAPTPEPTPEPEARPMVESDPEPVVAQTDETAPITEQWWFWTGVAGAAVVVATAAVVGTGVAVVASQPPPGPDEGSLGVVDLR